MPLNDYSDWLAHAADDLTDEQRETFDSVANAYFALPFHTKRDPADAVADSAEDDAALSAILQKILGEDSLMGAARRARQAEIDLDGWVRSEAAAGASERTLEEQSGLSRMTVRKRLGR
ncbi:MAG: hypothetical protein L0J57_00045 [Brachybacterium sp.]|nr:hypothetical protein [Kocuria sp.]MDN6301429.1 hypothetical protein [Brachybacterium sp.]